MRWGEVKRRLRALGMTLEAQRTRHELWRNPTSGRYTLVPRHDQQEAATGTLGAILRDLGVDRETFSGRSTTSSQKSERHLSEE